MQVHPHEKTKRKDFIHTTIDELNEARKWRCMLWSRLHGYFKDSLTLCYKIQSTKIAITAFLVWLSCFLISHQEIERDAQLIRADIFDSFAHIPLPVWKKKKKTRLTPNFKKQNTFVIGNDIIALYLCSVKSCHLIKYQV